MTGRLPRIVLAFAATVLLMAVVPAMGLAIGTSTSSTGQPVAGGWSNDPSTYLGEYHLSVPGAAAATPAATPAAGVFSLAVQAAAALGASTGPVSTGQLSVFLRKVKTGEPLAPSGILSVSGDGGNQVLYLTDMDVQGTTRTAVINGGGFLGVPIGAFTATTGTGGALDGVIKAPGLASLHVQLKRFSATPP